MRNLATVQKIVNIELIEGADRIELITIKGWKCIAEKHQFKVGDLCIYFEIDSVLSEIPEFEFLRKRCFVDTGLVKGFRIRTMKMKGVISQGICFPLTTFIKYLNIKNLKEGDDITEKLNVVLYEKPEKQIEKPKKWYKRILYYLKKLLPKEQLKFPKCCPVTDEDKIQNYPESFTKFKNRYFYISEKIDGSSSTFLLYKNKYYVCSRNLVINKSGIIKFFMSKVSKTYIKGKLDDIDIWNKISKKYNIEKLLREYKKRFKIEIAIQGEIIGPGIQDNKYKLTENELYVFGIFNVDEQKYFNLDGCYRILYFLNSMNNTKLKFVPIIDDKYFLKEDKTIDELVEMAKGKSEINSETTREGLVFRLNEDVMINKNKVSFKVINNDFLIEYSE